MTDASSADILVQLVIAPDNASQEQLPQDAWETIVSGLEALGGPLDQEDTRVVSVEELPLIQADLSWGDILRDGSLTHMPRPSLLAITMLPFAPAARKSSSATLHTSYSPPIPPHPSIVQRRMELLTSDMLTRTLTLVSRGQHDRAQHLLHETRSILKGLGKGGLPPVPPPQGNLPQLPPTKTDSSSPTPTTDRDRDTERRRTPSPTTPSITSARYPPPSNPPPPTPHSISGHSVAGTLPHTPSNADLHSSSLSAGIDATTVAALDAELEASLEWISHPAVFSRDTRKAVLQAIGVISSQRGYTFRTPIEGLWAKRVAGVRGLGGRSRGWREGGEGEGITEEG